MSRDVPVYVGHLEPCQTRYRDMISRYRYIPILNPISGTILQIPDIGYFPISGIPISGSISGYTDIGTKCHDIGSLSFPISHTMSLVPSRPRAQVWGWLSGCCRLLVIARESFNQCNELYSFFPAAGPQLRRRRRPGRRRPGRRRRRQQRQRPQRRWWGRRRWRVGKCLVVHNVQFCKPLVVLA